MKYRGVDCLNCGHPLDLTDRFCAYCGQLNTTKRLVLKDFFGEFFQSIFTYDSRFRYTLKDLLLKPGTITKNYVEGKRFTYANPFRFFLSLSIFYFILIAIISFFMNDGNPGNFNNANFRVNDTGTGFEIVEDNGQVQAAVDSLQNIEEFKTVPFDSLANIIQKKRKDSDSIYTYINETSLDTLNNFNKLSRKFTLFRQFREKTDIDNAKRGLDSLKYAQTKTNLWIYDRSDLMERILENPGKFASYMASKTPFFLFFFSPIFALFFWLIYSKKKFNYMEHLVLIFHIFAWVFLVLLIALPFDLLLPTDNAVAGILLLLIGPFYFYKALKNFYKQNRIYTLIKFVFLNFVFWISTSFFASLFFLIAATFF